MSELVSTANGYEIANPVPTVTAGEFQARMAAEYGFDGSTPLERAEQLKHMSVEGVAIMLEDINKSVQGSADSLVSHDRVIPIGGKQTIPLEHRYDTFVRLMQDIRDSPEDTNPARIGDVLALGVVALHPFHDGNGRTARVIGSMFREDYDNPVDYAGDFAVLTRPRDEARARNEFIIYGYVPQYSEGFDQSDPVQVSAYLKDLLHAENERAYTGPYGQAPLHAV